MNYDDQIGKYRDFYTLKVKYELPIAYCEVSCIIVDETFDFPRFQILK